MVAYIKTNSRWAPLEGYFGWNEMPPQSDKRHNLETVHNLGHTT